MTNDDGHNVHIHYSKLSRVQINKLVLDCACTEQSLVSFHGQITKRQTVELAAAAHCRQCRRQTVVGRRQSAVDVVEELDALGVWQLADLLSNWS